MHVFGEVCSGPLTSFILQFFFFFATELYEFYIYVCICVCVCVYIYIYDINPLSDIFLISDVSIILQNLILNINLSIMFYTFRMCLALTRFLRYQIILEYSD